ncbi:vacuolar protein sorting associated protein 8 [Echinococcus multilocularis]|uniref:Vacuolar protein sorting associated protein 8 n=1 Tax=Echinococcus multilocularis TaxID=6211 RepID=A0A068XZG3_ECHMU|nr:vacuolar protein sorting associated protein 8 [Echinococcus multilocularis]
MNDNTRSCTGYSTNSIFSDETDLASDIEADLQELPTGSEEADTDVVSFNGSTTNSFASPPFAGSFLSLLSESSAALPFSEDEALMQSSSQQRHIYLRAVSLKGVHTRLLNAQLRENCGSPSCISLQNFVAVGTNNGFIFVFDRRQELQLCIDTSTTEVGSGQGPITSLSQNLSSSRLLSGFASGRIVMWQLTKGDSATTICEDIENDDGEEEKSHPEAGESKTKNQWAGISLRIIDDAHANGQSVIFCAFTSLPTVAVSVDSSGSAYEMDFRRGILGRSTLSACFFSGSHGEICAISPLRPTHASDLLQNYQRQPVLRALLGSAMVAMASFTKVIVIVLKPKFRVIFWQHLKGPPSCLPLLAWCWCIPDATESKSDESAAFLGFARASTLYIARISTRSLSPHAEVPSDACVFGLRGRQFLHQFQLLRTISLDRRVVALHFFTLDHLAILDSEEILRLYDVSTEQEVESLNLTTIEISYNSSAFKALTIGVTVSKALTCASERACANSITSAGGKLLVLGKNGISMLVLKSWKERAISLFRAGRIEEALTSCRQVLQEGSPTPDLQESLLQVLTHMPLAQAKCRPTPPIVSILVEICVMADLMKFLTSVVIPAYRRDALTFPLLLRCLCTRLLQVRPIYAASDNGDDEFCLRHLPPDIGMELLTWCVCGPNIVPSIASPATVSLTSQSLSERRPSNHLQRLLSRVENGRPLAESCLVRFSPSSLNIDTVLKFCLSNGLYQGFMYVYAYVLKDHEAAFRWLTDLLIKKTQSHAERKPSLDTSPSFSDHSTASFESLDNLDTSEAVNTILLFLRSCFAGEEVFGMPLDPEFYTDVPNRIFNLLLSSYISSPENQQKSLFSHHTSLTTSAVPRLRALLHFGGTIDLLNMLTLVLRESPFFSMHQPSLDLSCQRRQRLFNALVTCALDEAGEALLPVDSADVTRLLCFIGEQILLPENASLTFESQKILKMLEYLSKRTRFCEVTNLPLTELSDVLYRLLFSGRLDASRDLLEVAENVGLSDFCEQVYRSQGKVEAVLSCLLTSLQRVISVQPVRDTVQLQDLVSRIFVFLSNCLSSPTETGNSFAPLVNRFLKLVEPYAHLDPLRSLILLMQAIGPSMRRILYALDTIFMSADPLPRNLLFHPTSSQPSQIPFDEMVPLSVEGPHHPAAILILEPFYELLNSEMPELERENMIATLAGNTNLRLALDELLSKPDPLVAELYVRLLLASNQRERVCEFLTLNREYRASVLLELLDEETYPQELACIYEKIEDKAKATYLLKKDFLAYWNRLVDCCSTAPTSKNSGWVEGCKQVRSRADAWFAFTARQCSSKRSSVNEPSWYDIIDALSALRKRQLSDQLTSELNGIFHKVLESASPYVPIPALINRVLQLSDATVASFGSATNRFLLQLVCVWQKEVSLMQDCHRLMASDISALEQLLVRALKRGLGLRRYSCALCGLTFARRYRQLRSLVTCHLHTGGFSTLDERQPTRSEVLLFWCGHGVHVDCYESCRDRHKSHLPEDRPFVCLQCTNLLDPSAPPPLAGWSGSEANGDFTAATTRSPSAFPSHLLDAHDEIQVDNISPDRPFLARPHRLVQESTNPFGDEEDE